MVQIGMACATCGSALNAEGLCPTCGRTPGDAAERRILTLCFVDLVASTELAEQLGLDDFDATLHDFITAATRVIAGFRGQIVQHYGDGILACFGLNESVEDAALAGLGCALALVAEIPRQMPDCNVRVGLHSGAVLCRLGTTDADRPQLSGLDLNITARIQTEARPATVLTSDRFTQFVRRIARLNIAESKLVQLKGTSVETMVHEVASFTAADQTTGATLLLERDALIWGCLNAERRNLLLVGPVGIGKSAIAQEMIARSEHTSPTRTAIFSARSNLTRSPLVPITDGLRQLLLQAGDLAAQGIAVSPNLMGGLAELLNPDLVAIPHAELSPQLRRQNRIDAAAAIILSLLRHPAALVLCDDFHWFDTDSREVIASVIKASADLPGRVILLSRPTPDVADYAQTHGVETAHIPPLSDDASRSVMFDEVQADFGDAVARRLVQTSGGNPLFLRVLARAEMLRPSGDQPAQTPPTIEATIQNLLGELGPLKETVLNASVIGRIFRQDHLQYLADPSVDLDAHMRRLHDLGVIAPTRQGYDFQHILLRDCAYEMLPLRRRRALHGRFARARQHNDPAECAAFPELLADHFIQAQAMDDAVGPCIAAGLKFLGSATFDHAITYLERAVTTLAQNSSPDKAASDLLIQAQTLLGAAKVQRFGFSHPEVARTYQELDQRVTTLSAGSLERMYALYGLFANSVIGGKVRDSGAILARMKQIADPASSEQQLLYLVNETAHLMYSAEFDAALISARKLQAIYDPALHGRLFYLIGADPLVSALSATCFIETVTGNLAAGHAARQAALAHIDLIGARLQLPWVHIFAAGGLLLAGQYDDFHQQIEIGHALAEKQGSGYWILTGHLWKSAGAVWTGNPAAGEAGLSALLPTAGAIGIQIGWPLFTSALAEARLAQGDWDAAAALSQAALLRIEEDGERIWQTQVLASRQRILAARSP